MSDAVDVRLTDGSAFILHCREKTLDCRPGGADGIQIAGILNVTPDSFYDGGDFMDHGVALRRAEQIVSEGASIIDIGGASSRPRGKTYGAGAAAVSADEEWRRIHMIVRGILRELPEAVLSVDTYHLDVAKRALDAGAHIINDITALRVSPGIADVVAEAGAGLVLMHSVGVPGDMPQARDYRDVVAEVRSDLARAFQAAKAAGVRSIILDPGFGFGKSRADNLKLIAETEAFVSLGAPVMVGVSRKSSIGSTLASTSRIADSPDATIPPSDRLFGSLGATAVALVHGATIVRTHDVRETAEMARLIGATLASSNEA